MKIIFATNISRLKSVSLSACNATNRLLSYWYVGQDVDNAEHLRYYQMHGQFPIHRPVQIRAKRKRLRV